VARSADVTDEPVQVTLLGEPFVLVRLDATLVAFADRCPHRLAPLSAGCVVRGELQCGYHGWRYNRSGACVAIPALGPDAAIPSRARLNTPHAVSEHGGLVWVAPETPVVELAPLAELHDPAFRWGTLAPATVDASAGVLLDNFCDVAHFPFLHARTIGSDAAIEVSNISVEVDGDGWIASYADEQLFANREDPAVARGERPELQHRRVTYEYRAPFMASIRIDYVEAPGTNIIVFAAQPETSTRCRVYTAIGRNDLADDAALGDALAFEQRILDEDLAFQHGAELPFSLDPRAEVHTRADRFTLEIRRILSRLVAAPA
jgi:phenylpropionate dioxygenase-like ring-hydroxylating dioxygenase large terminal subunit